MSQSAESMSSPKGGPLLQVDILGKRLLNLLVQNVRMQLCKKVQFWLGRTVAAKACYTSSVALIKTEILDNSQNKRLSSTTVVIVNYTYN